MRTDDVGSFIPRGVDFAFEASANARGMEEAWHATRSAGHVVLASMPWKLDDMVSLPAVPATIFGKTLHSSQWGTSTFCATCRRYIRLIESGEVRIAPLISGISRWTSSTTCSARSRPTGCTGRS